MPHDTSLITTIVSALVLAFILGALANRLRMPPLVGYLLAGVVAGPYTPGLVIDQALAPQLAEIGVILLMFGVGLHFSLKDLLSVRAVAIPGALVQIAGATGMGWGLATLLGWPTSGGIIFGLSLSVASTVVLLKALQDRRLTDSDRGRIAVGWLIVEDIATVLALVMIPAFAGLPNGATLIADPFVSFVERLAGHTLDIYWVLAITLVKLTAFVGFMLVVGRRIIPAILHATAHTGSRELFRLAVLAIALGVAAGAAYLFGVSLALGAFFAGMILSESELSHRAAEETLPLRDAFAVLFFVSVGMLLKPDVFLSSPLALLGVLAIVIVGKSALALALTLAFRRPIATALTIAASLAQIGEFSFILAQMGTSLGLLPDTGLDLIVAGALISMLLNPLMFWIADRVRPALEEQMRIRRAIEPDLGPQIREEPELETDMAGAESQPPPAFEEEAPSRVRIKDHTILVGYGRVGSVIGEGLAATDAPVVLIEDAENRIAAARAAGMPVVPGNAADPGVLRLANIEEARCLVVAIPNAFEAGQATQQARKLNADIRIIVRSHSEEEDQYFKDLGADTVIKGEREIGLGMLACLRGERDGDAAPAAPKLASRGNVLVSSIAQPPQGEPEIDPMHEAEVAESVVVPPDEAEPASPDASRQSPSQDPRQDAAAPGTAPEPLAQAEALGDKAAFLEPEPGLLPAEAVVAEPAEVMASEPFAEAWDEDPRRLFTPPIMRAVFEPVAETETTPADIEQEALENGVAGATFEPPETVENLPPEVADAAARAEVESAQAAAARAASPPPGNGVMRPEPMIVPPGEGPDEALLKDVSPPRQPLAGPRVRGPEPATDGEETAAERPLHKSS